MGWGYENIWSQWLEDEGYKQGIIDATPGELRSRYLQKTMPTLNELEIDVPVAFDAATKRWGPSQPLDWDKWDAVGRRGG